MTGSTHLDPLTAQFFRGFLFSLDFSWVEEIFENAVQREGGYPQQFSVIILESPCAWCRPTLGFPEPTQIWNLGDGFMCRMSILMGFICPNLETGGWVYVQLEQVDSFYSSPHRIFLFVLLIALQREMNHPFFL